MDTLRKTWNQNNQPTLNQKFRSTTKKQSESCKEVPNQQHAQQLKVAELEIATLNPPVLSSEIWVPFFTENWPFWTWKLAALWVHPGGGDTNYGIIMRRNDEPEKLGKLIQKNALKVYMDCPHIKHPCLGIMVDVCFFSCCFFSPLSHLPQKYGTVVKKTVKITDHLLVSWWKPGALAIMHTMPT